MIKRVHLNMLRADRFDMLELEIRTLLAANKLIRKGILQTLSWKK